MCGAAELEYVLGRLRSIGRIGVIRVSTRAPVVFPEAVDRHLKALKRYGPMWLIVHINHPREVDAGIHPRGREGAGGGRSRHKPDRASPEGQ